MKKLAFVAAVALLSLPGSASTEKEHTRVGEMAPPKLAVSGRKTLADFHGKPVLIHLWATWCGPCRESLPLFRVVASAYKNTDLQVFLLDRDDNSTAARMYLAQQGIGLPDTHDYGDFFKTFGGHGIPATVLIDRDGIVRYHHTGEGTSEKGIAKLQRAIDRSLKKPLTPPDQKPDASDDDKDGQ